MPIYEYICGDCAKRSSIFFRSFSEVSVAVCPNCSSDNMDKLVSKFTIGRPYGDFMKNLPSWETMTDFDENDPQSTAKMLRIWKDAMGENIGPQGEELQAYQDISDITSEFESGSLDSL
ncbi:MAG: zinc ribbon domain-containing protein [SAR202 cluster bacterium]|nr:zinc ribbon domain-containing protein [SAR202 cluster bacterium]